MTQKRNHNDMKAIRWDESDWEMVGKLAARIGLSRSAFVKKATLGEAAKLLAGAVPHYVSGPSASTHNGGANTFSDAKQMQKRLPEEGGAGFPTAGGSPKLKAEGVTTNEHDPAKKRRAM